MSVDLRQRFRNWTTNRLGHKFPKFMNTLGRGRGHTMAASPAAATIAERAAESMSPVAEPSPFAELNSVLEAYFFEPDLQAIRIVLGTIKAHYLNIGDPAWLFIVAPPGSGKTTSTIMGASGLPEVISLSEFTENTFLSGFHGHAQPGLLEKLGIPIEHGGVFETEGSAIFLAKDFTTVLSMRREKRAVILGQLREIHDGSFKRAFGTGVTKAWRGRITIIAAVTPILDTHYSIFSVLGERFLQVRWHRPTSEEAGEWAIRQQGQEAEIQRQCREAITRIFERSTSSAPILARTMQKRIASLAEVVALGRTHIVRNSWGREIEYVPEPEANTRVSKGLASIAKGVAALNQRTEVAEDDLQDAFRVGLDCIPDTRKRLLLAVHRGEGVSSVSLPRTVRERELEDLAALQIFEEADSPQVSQRIAKLLEVAAPELG